MRNKFLLRLEVDGYQLTVFPDGRAIIGGTDDMATARTLHGTLHRQLNDLPSPMGRG